MPEYNAQPHATPWPSQLIKLLGQRPDNKIAKLAGCSNESVRRERARRKIAPYRSEIAWTPKLEAMLGKRSDADVARLAGCSARAVKLKRLRVGIQIRPRQANG